ncbi:MAG TPA: sialidase family protein [Candidatus Thermoplasmatota archaeon]|nr:sialidase family protein [Candidatus Thermoplasmatota archaeon]
MSKPAFALAALLALSPALAGCLQDDGLPLTPLSDMVQTFPGQFTWRAPVAYDGNGTPVAMPLSAEEMPVGVESLVPKGGAEPNTGVTSSGAVFVTAGDSVFRSRDKGLTWEEVHRLVPPGYPLMPDQWRSYDPMLWVDTDTDRVYVNHMNPAIFCTYMAWSDDDGESWFERPYSCLLPQLDHQKVMTARPGPQAKTGTLPGYPNVLYVCVNKRVEVIPIENPVSTGTPADSAGNLGTTCFVSLDGGYTYAYETAAYVNDQDCGNINGHPAAYPDGTVVLILGNLGGKSCVRPLTAIVTEDNGLTWEPRVCDAELGQKEIDADVTVTPDGTAYALYRDDDHLPYLLRTTDKFRTCETFKVAPPDITVATFAGITSGDDGRVAMAWLGTRDPQEPGVEPSNVTPGTTWHLFVTTSFDAASENPTFVTQQVTPEEDPVQVGCVWLHGGGGGPQSCRNLLDFIDMTRDPDGRYVVAITDGCTPRNGCSGTPEQSDFQSRDRQIAVVVQDRGMGLFAEKGILPPIGLVPPQPLER